jgi:leader peptidase (prepilin peptidase)/N-methyltransferase
MDTIVLMLFFVFGAIIGSFLNVVILRYRSGRTLGGRSMCFSCGHELAWPELVPIASFATQGGRCVNCRTKISWQYPLVEALTGFLFVFLYLRFGWMLMVMPAQFAVTFGYYALVSSLLVVLSVYDIKHKILPDGMTLTLAVIAFIGMFLFSGDMLAPHLPHLSMVMAGIVLPLPFACLWYVSGGKWMGLGDPKLMVGMGWLLGLYGGIAAILLAFWIGAAISLIWVLGVRIFRKKHLSIKVAIPFGPFLALSTVIVILTQTNIFSILAWFARV